ncbi:MAG: hypothetical protein AB7F43_11750 [Bacteriovoracia bacterium]
MISQRLKIGPPEIVSLLQGSAHNIFTLLISFFALFSLLFIGSGFKDAAQALKKEPMGMQGGFLDILQDSKIIFILFAGATIIIPSWLYLGYRDAYYFFEIQDSGIRFFSMKKPDDTKLFIYFTQISKVVTKVHDVGNTLEVWFLNDQSLSENIKSTRILGQRTETEIEKLKTLFREKKILVDGK